MNYLSALFIKKIWAKEHIDTLLESPANDIDWSNINDCLKAIKHVEALVNEYKD